MSVFFQPLLFRLCSRVSEKEDLVIKQMNGGGAYRATPGKASWSDNNRVGSKVGIGKTVDLTKGTS